MNNANVGQTSLIDQEVLNRIVREVFERIGTTAPPRQSTGAAPGAQDNLPIDTKRIPVGVSVRHIHLCQEHLEKLFGPGAGLHHLRELYQPGTHAEKETLALIGPKTRLLDRVRILGPLRDRTQVELAKTDAIFLGVDAPLRISGDIKGSAPITLIGTQTAITSLVATVRGDFFTSITL